MSQNIQYYRKTKYPDKFTKPKCLVFARIFLFRFVGNKITYFPTNPYYYLATSATLDSLITFTFI